jgi:DNA invertase Pin-like site-specific DNA recombinase
MPVVAHQYIAYLGRAMAGTAAVWAELERALTSKRTKEGMAEKARIGSWRNGRGPGRERSVSAQAIRYLRRHAGRKSQAQLARDLDELGIPAPTGGRWNQQAVSRVLRR